MLEMSPTRPHGEELPKGASELITPTSKLEVSEKNEKKKDLLSTFRTGLNILPVTLSSFLRVSGLISFLAASIGRLQAS